MMDRVLTINGGSSSIKFALFATGASPSRLLAGTLDRIGDSNATLRTSDAEGRPSAPQAFDAPNHERAIGQIIEWLDHNVRFESVAAIGHRIVHGGPRLVASQRVTPALIEELTRLVPLDPVHLPGEIALLEALAAHRPRMTQIACFDTAFHHDLPRCARILPVPRHYEAVGVRRYGFHGLSYAFLMHELAHIAGPRAAAGRVILAHLGAGASLAAVRDGKCIDTSMAFTPTAGLVMGTRCGDLDPGFLTYLLRTERMTADQIDDLVNRRSGLLGISATSSDMRDLLRCQAEDPRAADAVALFCYQAKKWIGSFAAALGGLDTLVFAGGIGENSPEVRSLICAGLGFLGVELDTARNAANGPVISTDSLRVSVRVIRTDEELMIAREVQWIIDGNASLPASAQQS